MYQEGCPGPLIQLGQYFALVEVFSLALDHRCLAINEDHIYRTMFGFNKPNRPNIEGENM